MNTLPTNRRQRDRGVVMILTLLALLLLVGLVLWVMNLGQQVDRKIDTQQAADSTAVAGAGWVARSMNLTAENNLTMSRYIAAINVLDAMPMAVDFSYREQQSLQQALGPYISNPGNGPASLMDRIHDLLDEMDEQLEKELDMLEPVNDFFKDYDVREMTWYNAPGGMGRMWQAMVAMREINRATLDNLAHLAQMNAVTGGSLNLPPEMEEATALLIPIRPELPHEEGRFDDFERPVKYGLLPYQVDDRVERRGPFDTMFGWHRRHGRLVGAEWVPGRRSAPPGGGGRGNVPIGRGSGGSGGGGGHMEGGVWEWTHYSTWGWMDYYLSGGNWSDPDHGFSGTFANFRWSNMYYSRIDWWLRQIANMKFGYLWPGDVNRDGNYNDQADLDAVKERVVVDPNWITDYQTARQYAATREGRSKIKETAFIAVEIKSRYPEGDGSFMAAGSWAPVEENENRQPRVVRVRGWQDPERWTVGGNSSVQKVGNSTWYDTWDYDMYWDLDIGLTPSGDAGGYSPQKVYRFDHFYFVGINIGEEVPVEDPYQGLNRSGSETPVPMHMKHAVVTTEPESRFEYLTFLAAALQPDSAQSWREEFYSGKPYPRVVALAQAKVFNNHSWDLWTPMWHAQIEPIYNYDKWMTALGNGLGQGTTVRELDMGEVDQLYRHLQGLSGLAQSMVRH